MKKIAALVVAALLAQPCFCWGFFAHRKINYYAIFLLPPEMIRFYKPNAEFLVDHAVDPDKRRYAVAEEGSRHFMDIDHYGSYPYVALPRKWEDAVAKYSRDTLETYGIVPWWTQVMLNRLTAAFKERNATRILKLSAEIGHYIADAHVPLHANSNHNGQLTDQRGIHGFWESRIPELLADKEWDFFIGKAEYIAAPGDYIWNRLLESAAAADSVLITERLLSMELRPDQKFAFELRNGIAVRQYSSAFSTKYDALLYGMIERRMRQSVQAVASFWYTAWVNAGQPPLSGISVKEMSVEDREEFDRLNEAWKSESIKGREHEAQP